MNVVKVNDVRGKGLKIEDGDIVIIYIDCSDDVGWEVIVKEKSNIYNGMFYDIEEGDEDWVWWMKDEEEKKGNISVSVDKKNKKVIVNGKEYVIDMNIKCKVIDWEDWWDSIDEYYNDVNELLK